MMNKVFGRAIVLSFLALSLPSTVSADGEKVLVFRDSLPYNGHQAAINACMPYIKGLAAANGFSVDTTIHLSSFNTANLAQYAAVIFVNPYRQNPNNVNLWYNDTMTADQDSALKSWLLTGKGFVGIHDYSRMNLNWPWFYKTFSGLKYKNDIGPQTATFHVADTSQFLTKGIPQNFTDNQQVRMDSIFFTETDTSFKVLIRADDNDYPVGQKQSFYPFVYRHNYQGARCWNGSMGHTAATWNSGSNWSKLLLNGILYALNRPGYGTSAIVVGSAPKGFSLNRLNNANVQSLQYGLPQRVHVVIQLFDLEGRILSKLVDETFNAGSYSVPLPAGLRGSYYLVDFEAGNFHRTMKIDR